MQPRVFWKRAVPHAARLLLCAALAAGLLVTPGAKYVGDYPAPGNFMWIHANTRRTAADAGTNASGMHKPSLAAIAGTNVQGWWAFLLRGGDGRTGVRGTTNRLGGKGGLVMGCVYVGAGQQLFGLAGAAGGTGSATGGAYSPGAGFGGGRSRGGANNELSGGGGGASILARAAASATPVAPSAANIIAVAGGGGGGSSSSTGILGADNYGGNAGCISFPGIRFGSPGGGNGDWSGGRQVGGTNGGGTPPAGEASGSLQGASGGSNHNAGGGSGYYGGGNGNNPGAGNRTAGGGGSSFLKVNDTNDTSVHAIPKNHFTYNVLNPLYTAGYTALGTTGGGNNAAGYIYLIYMGDNRLPTIPTVWNDDWENNRPIRADVSARSGSTAVGTTSQIYRPDLKAIAGTDKKGWWAFVMRGGDGGYVMGCVYVGAGQQLFGLAGAAGTMRLAGSGFSQSAGIGGGRGRYGDSGGQSGVGGGGGASVLFRAAAGGATMALPGAATTHATASAETYGLIAVAGGGGGGASTYEDRGSGGIAGSIFNNPVGVANGGPGGNTSNNNGKDSPATNNGGNPPDGESSGFLQGSSGSSGTGFVGLGLPDTAAGGSGYFGGGNGNDPTAGYKSGGGGGSSYLKNTAAGVAGGARAIPTTHYVFACLVDLYGETGTGFASTLAVNTGGASPAAANAAPGPNINTAETSESSNIRIGGGDERNGFIVLMYMGDNNNSTTPPATAKGYFSY